MKTCQPVLRKKLDISSYFINQCIYNQTKTPGQVWLTSAEQETRFLEDEYP